MVIDAFFVRLLCMLFMHFFWGGGEERERERNIDGKGGE